MAGAPEGNQNATKNKPWSAAINRALAQNPDKLRALADKLLDKALEGDMSAMKEMGDRVDGKPTQPLANDPEHPLFDASMLTPTEREQRVVAKLREALLGELTKGTGTAE